MFRTEPNQKTVTLKLKRREVIDLILACNELARDGNKWGALHDKIRRELDKHDDKERWGD